VLPVTISASLRENSVKRAILSPTRIWTGFDVIEIAAVGPSIRTPIRSGCGASRRNLATWVMRENAEIDLLDAQVVRLSGARTVPVVEPLESGRGGLLRSGPHGALPCRIGRLVTLRRLPHKRKCHRPCPVMLVVQRRCQRRSETSPLPPSPVPRHVVRFAGERAGRQHAERAGADADVTMPIRRERISDGLRSASGRLLLPSLLCEAADHQHGEASQKDATTPSRSALP